jgi:hypothetical protein
MAEKRQKNVRDSDALSTVSGPISTPFGSRIDGRWRCRLDLGSSRVHLSVIATATKFPR